MRFLLPIILLVVSTGTVRSQDVLRFDGEGSATDRHAEAQSAAEASGLDVWIGFSVTRMMRENSVMGRFIGNRKSSPTLEELLDPSRESREPTVEEAARKALGDMEKKESVVPDRLIPKRVAVLVRHDRDGTIGDIAWSNLTMAFDPGDRPLYWIGHVDDGPAFDLLRRLYLEHRSEGSDVGEDLISAIGLLDTPDVHEWLLGIVDSERPTNEREQAVFWLGESENPDIIRRLYALADDDPSEDVREQAVFALYRMDSGEALDRIIRLAREADHEETREKSRFWLAQQAGDRLVDASDAPEPTEMEKQAVFALSRLDDADALSELSTVALGHRNPHVRKQALFWLGQREDDEALEAILKVLNGGR